MNSRLPGMVAGMSLLALTLVTSSPRAWAQITLLSEQLRSGSGSVIDPAGPGNLISNPTNWSGGPFPDDGINFTNLDQFGLDINVNQMGRRESSHGILVTSTSWRAHDFTVRFRIDQPLEYTFVAQDSPAGTPGRPIYGLQAEGQPRVFVGTPSSIMQGSTQRTGILPAGTYSLGGNTAIEFPLPTGPVGFYLLEEVPLQAHFSIVAPEPAALPVMAALVLCAGRRRPRQQAA
jgi:hypothetical protein